jgi:hypothetical protein
MSYVRFPREGNQIAARTLFLFILALKSGGARQEERD